MEQAPEPVVTEVYCPRCGRKTDRFQASDVPICLFLFVYLAWGQQKVCGCPRCVRTSLLKWLLPGIPAANVLCCVYVPWYLILIANSFANDTPGIPPEYAGLALMNPEDKAGPSWQGTAKGQTLRLLIALLLIAVAIAVVFFVLPGLVSP